MFRIWKWGHYDSLIHFSEYSKYFRRIVGAFSTRDDGAKYTHYEVLGISREATGDDIRTAFIKKSKECHPDINKENPNNHKQFVLVNEAYSVLSKPPLRRDYDATITHHRFNENSRPQGSHSSFYHPKEYYDEQVHQAKSSYSHRKEYYDEQIRKASHIRDEDYKNHSHNSAKRRKISNTKVVVFCILWTLAGMVVHYFVFWKSTSLHLKTLDERDARIHEALVNAKKLAEMYSVEDHILLLIRKQEQDKAQRSNADKNK